MIAASAFDPRGQRNPPAIRKRLLSRRACCYDRMRRQLGGMRSVDDAPCLRYLCSRSADENRREATAARRAFTIE
jgi:hypothetical protein